MVVEEALMNLGVALRRPRLIAAACCFLLGAGVLAGGLVARLGPGAPAAADPAAADLGGDLGLAPLGADRATPALAPGDGLAELVVYVSGAVPRPDVYRLAPGARVKDAVVAAGGLRPDAAAELINLAEPLADAAHVHIPAASAAAGSPAVARAAQAEPELIDLNAAAEADLEELPGVGTTLAARIVARRAEVGPYGAVEELREVTGVGEKLYAQIAPLVTIRR